MASRSLADILQGIDPASIVIDSNGRIVGVDDLTKAKLLDLDIPEVLEAAPMNGIMCQCQGGGGSQSGCS